MISIVCKTKGLKRKIKSEIATTIKHMHTYGIGAHEKLHLFAFLFRDGN